MKITINASALAIFAIALLSIATAAQKTSTSAGPDCVRSAPAPITKKNIFPRSKFSLSTDSKTGTEIVDLAANGRLVIKNSGCEYYVLKLRFESARVAHDPADAAFWYRNAAVRLDAISRGLESSIDLRQAAKKLRQVAGQTKKGKPLKFGRDITFVPGEIRQFMTVDGVIKMRRGVYALEITLAAGPL